MAKNSVGVSTEPAGKYIVNTLIAHFAELGTLLFELNIFLCLFYDGLYYCGRLINCISTLSHFLLAIIASNPYVAVNKVKCTQMIS